MFTKDQIVHWAKAFDFFKYPVRIYEDLVIKGIEHPQRFSIMGAWKTGCLRHGSRGTAYTDSLGQRYSYTKRWRQNAPVGFDTWHYLDREGSRIFDALPAIFPKEMPKVLIALADRLRFGFVWAVFVAHICFPKIYPLYDQHVYRAYKSFDSSSAKLPAIAPPDWKEYQQYQRFFIAQRNAVNMNPIIIDRALWTYGRSKKPYSRRNVEGQSDLREGESTEWARSTTLGHAKNFWWKIDKNCNITFARKFNTRIGAISNTTGISVDILSALLAYLPNDKWFMLSHNVVKLAKGTEVDGIGKFLHSQGFTETQSQIASHLATVFYRADVWRYNGKRKGMKFQKKCDVTNWCECLRHYYLSLLSKEDV